MSKGLRLGLTVFAVWTVIATLAALGGVVYRVRAGMRVDLPMFLAEAYVDWYTCAVFTPFIFWLSRRFPITRDRLLTHIPLHLLATVAFIAMKLAIFLPIAARMNWINPETTFGDQMLRSAFALTLTYWVVLGAEHGLKYYRRQVQLEASLSEARLRALKAQIHPHFLFNALNAVATLMHRDVAAADRMVLELGELLRESMQSEAKQETTIADEIRLVQHYLHIMGIRFGDRLAAQVDIAPDTNEALVPHLLLQPIIENVVRHGLERSGAAISVAVRTARRNGKLEITVVDNGPGFAALPPRSGLGLQNTRDRLEQLYGSAAVLQFDNVPEGGARVQVTVPFRTVSA